MAALQIVQFPQRSSCYPLVLPLRYQARDQQEFYVDGEGETVAISGKDVVFVAEERLFPGLTVELNVDWPVVLDNTVPLRVRMTGTIERIDDIGVHVAIKTHEFQTRGKAGLAGDHDSNPNS